MINIKINLEVNTFGMSIRIFSLLIFLLRLLIILVIKLLKLIVYGTIAFVALILRLFNINLPLNNIYLRQYKFKSIEDELNKIDLFDGIEFEEYIADLLKILGYSNAEITQASVDYGVDIIATDVNIMDAIKQLL